MQGEPPERRTAERFLSERYGGRASAVNELGRGDWSRAYSFRLDGRDLVLRFSRHREDFVRDREAMAFHRPELPVPAVLEIGEAFGGHYAVSERRFGVFLEALDEGGWRRVLPVVLGALDALRDAPLPGAAGVDWADETGNGPSSWRESLLRSLDDRPGERVSGWRDRIGEIPDVERLFVAGERRVRTLVPDCPEIRHVIHRDLLNRNVLVAPDGSRLEAVFDWGCSVAGDFLYEIAWFTFWAPWYPALEALDFRHRVEDHYAAIGLAVERFEKRLACYELHIGLDHIAYAAFTEREDDLRSIVRRTARVLEGAPR